MYPEQGARSCPSTPGTAPRTAPHSAAHSVPHTNLHLHPALRPALHPTPHRAPQKLEGSPASSATHTPRRCSSPSCVPSPVSDPREAGPRGPARVPLPRAPPGTRPLQIAHGPQPTRSARPPGRRGHGRAAAPWGKLPCRREAQALALRVLAPPCGQAPDPPTPAAQKPQPAPTRPTPYPPHRPPLPIRSPQATTVASPHRGAWTSSRSCVRRASADSRTAPRCTTGPWVPVWSRLRSQSSLDRWQVTGRVS